MDRIAQAKRAAAEKYGDELPLEALERARLMAEAQGWVRVRMVARIERKAEQIGEDVVVPIPGQDVGSGSRPSKRDPKPLGIVFDHLVKTRGWGTQLEIGSMAARWPDIVGEAIANNCQVESFEDGVLTLRAGSTSWQTQMRALSAFLDKRLEEELGPGVVKEIVVGGPFARSWKHGRYSVPGRGPRDTYG
ncbi:DUF721 domain-containing protein [Trueperella sp. HMSC08H06]|uniref:DUF721 domain-containing protein n=1 Tax=Trueperella sp. HMSC08H06 TaxID=1581142 RepID=UPI0008A2171D|nr:DciA family protein [Trueperella sp. HMSC08H06]OFS67935.1 protein in RecF-GyrB intergenic region [Trueperella sp. HMSC08H06]